MVDKPFTWSTPISSGFESFEVRNSLPWLRARLAEAEDRANYGLQPRERLDSDDLRALRTTSRQGVQPLGETSRSLGNHYENTQPPSQRPLVYSSISDTKFSNSTKRIDLYPVSARLIREKIHTDHTPPLPIELVRRFKLCGSFFSLPSMRAQSDLSSMSLTLVIEFFSEEICSRPYVTLCI